MVDIPYCQAPKPLSPVLNFQYFFEYARNLTSLHTIDQEAHTLHAHYKC